MRSDEIIKSVIAKLKYLHDVPADELETGIEEVNLKMIDLRDRTIEQVRKNDRQDLRNFLKQINLALSVIFGLEYPVTGFQRDKIKLAIDVLNPIAGFSQ